MTQGATTNADRMLAPFGPTLKTERLILRPPRADDLDGFAEFQADPEATRFFGGPGPRTTAWRVLALLVGGWMLQGFGQFSVIERATGRWIGRIGPWSPESWPGTDMVWALLPSAQGRGYASEGSAAAIDWAVDHLGWNDIVSPIDPANAASIALARRLGAKHHGSCRRPMMHGEEQCDLWSQSAADWRARRVQPSL